VRFGSMEKPNETPKLPEIIRISERLKELRKSKGYKSYEHIAFELEMSRSAYWRLETGANFELKTLVKICKLLGITLEEFFQGINVPTKEKKKK
jgi:transcriptional regulator with XRE-family HTH domain